MHKKIAKYLFCGLEWLRGENVCRRLRELERHQYSSIVEVEAVQKAKVSSLLDVVMRSNSYYKEKFKGYDWRVDFALLPILTKEELRENYKEILTDGIGKNKYLVETSGSTGVPLQFYRDRVVFSYTLASLYRGHRWWGLDIGTKEAMLWGVPIDFKNRLKMKAKDFLLNRFREKEYNLNNVTLIDFYSKIKRGRPGYLFGYTSMVYEFALFLQRKGYDGISLGLKNVICTAEKITAGHRAVIENVFGCKVISEYGATETGIISYECPEGTNHIADDCVLVEIVDDNNLPVPEGVPGKVLVTVLHSFSAPIIRYELGDIACKSSRGCPCGVNLSSLQDIVGRTSDVVVTPNGQSYHSIIFYYLIKDFTEKYGGITQYKVRQVAINMLEFHLVFVGATTHVVESYIKKQVRDKFGCDMEVKYFYHDYLRREKSGKLRDFESVLDTTSAREIDYGVV